MPAPEYLHQHTVTKAVVRKFAWGSSGQGEHVCVYDREKNRVFPKASPRRLFQIKNFIEHEGRQAEERWQQVERDLGKAYAALEARCALDDPAVVDTLRDLLALHWVRSPSLKVVHDHVRQQVIEDSQARFRQRPDLLGFQFTRVTGLEATGAGSVEWANERLHTLPEEVPQIWWSLKTAEYFEHARQWFKSSHLQIGYADRADLVIGDVPVLTTRDGQPGHGPHQGVPLAQANRLVMPISPTILLALGREPAQMALASDVVDYYNAQQAQSFVRWLACRPGSASVAVLKNQVQLG